MFTNEKLLIQYVSLLIVIYLQGTKKPDQVKKPIFIRQKSNLFFTDDKMGSSVSVTLKFLAKEN